MDLKEFLVYSGMKQSELAKRAKVPQHTISRLKKGKEINLSTAIRICLATKGKVTAEDLYNTLISRKNVESKTDNKNNKNTSKNKKVPKIRVVTET